MQHHDFLYACAEEKKQTEYQSTSLSSFVPLFAILTTRLVRTLVYPFAKKETRIVPNITFIVCLLLKLQREVLLIELILTVNYFYCQTAVCYCDR